MEPHLGTSYARCFTQAFTCEYQVVKSKNMPEPVLEATEATNSAIKDCAASARSLQKQAVMEGVLGRRMLCGSVDGVGQEVGQG